MGQATSICLAFLGVGKTDVQATDICHCLFSALTEVIVRGSLEETDQYVRPSTIWPPSLIDYSPPPFLFLLTL